MPWKPCGPFVRACEIASSPKQDRSGSTSTCSWETKMYGIRVGWPLPFQQALKFRLCPLSAAARSTPPGRLSKLLQNLDVAPVVPVFFVGRFQNKRLLTQRGVRQNTAKTLFADVPFADIFMPVQMRAQPPFGIVGVDHFHVLQSQNALRLGYRFFQARLAR